MLAFGTRSHGETKRRLVKGSTLEVHKAEWMETGENQRLSPTVSLIEQPPFSVAEAHFHGKDQFQLFIDGDGHIGPKPLAPLTIHYAGAYTAYGPLKAGERGLTYFTVRAIYETGLFPVSTHRDKMAGQTKRHVTSAPINLSSPEELRGLTSREDLQAIPLADDGLGAVIVRLPPDLSMTVVVPARSPGAFLFVLGGEVKSGEDAVLSHWESLFTTGDHSPEVRAGSNGAELAILTMPEQSLG